MVAPLHVIEEWNATPPLCFFFTTLFNCCVYRATTSLCSYCWFTEGLWIHTGRLSMRQVNNGGLSPCYYRLNDILKCRL